MAEHFKNDPNLDGVVVPSISFPWFQSGTPATDEYQQVMRTFGSKHDHNLCADDDGCIATPRGPEVKRMSTRPRRQLAANLVPVDRACKIVTFSLTPRGGRIERKLDRNAAARTTLSNGGECLLQTCRHVSVAAE